MNSADILRQEIAVRQAALAALEGQIPVAAPKRRGRPPKNASLLIDATDVVAPPKKPKPAKNAAPIDPATGEPVKRKRGRPKKVAA